MPGYTPFENLQRLWSSHDELLPWAEIVIHDKSHLKDHVELVEVYMGTVEYLRPNIPKDDYHFAIGGLFLRTFDQTGHAVRAAMSGNYVGSAMYARDLLETQFLISYLMDLPEKAVEWLHSDPDGIRRNFKQVEIRKHLDNRDGFKAMKRASHYKVLSTLGAHPTPQSFALKRDGGGVLHSGPLKQRELVSECMEDIAKCCLLLSGSILEHLADIEQGARIGSRLSIIFQRTRERYFNDFA